MRDRTRSTNCYLTKTLTLPHNSISPLVRNEFHALFAVCVQWTHSEEGVLVWPYVSIPSIFKFEVGGLLWKLFDGFSFWSVSVHTKQKNRIFIYSDYSFLILYFHRTCSNEVSACDISPPKFFTNFLPLVCLMFPPSHPSLIVVTIKSEFPHYAHDTLLKYEVPCTARIKEQNGSESRIFDR
jgi:hypothetical protein